MRLNCGYVTSTVNRRNIEVTVVRKAETNTSLQHAGVDGSITNKIVKVKFTLEQAT
jgi:hypothetical protein